MYSKNMQSVCYAKPSVSSSMQQRNVDFAVEDGEGFPRLYFLSLQYMIILFATLSFCMF